MPPSPAGSPILGRDVNSWDRWRTYVQYDEDEEDEDGLGGDAVGGEDEAEGLTTAMRELEPKESPSLPVYVTIHRIRRLILSSIDDPYTADQLRDPRMNMLVVRPLVEKLYELNDISVVYCLLANRVQFLREQSAMVHHTVNIARATLCELLAARVLRRFHERKPGSQGLILLANILVRGFDPFDGAPEAVRQALSPQWSLKKPSGHQLSALELAIVSESKIFISSAACQRLVNAVYDGRVTYSPSSLMDILPDRYKNRPISLYNPRKAPLLNHYRLIVPRARHVIELVHFLILIVLYALTMVYRNSRNELFELAFCVYTAGWVLDEFAAIFEHGWDVRSQNLWSFLDLSFTIVYFGYLFGRAYDIFSGSFPDGIGLKILSIAAPVLLTRIAFTLMPDNIVFISLHAMMRDFMVLTFLSVWCFTGFLLALQWIISANDNNSVTPSWITIAKWMLCIWFGLDGTGIDESVHFHVVLGPALMVAFAFLGNTLFLTILVAVLTNTFSKIIADEAAEIQFRRTVLTFEGVKSDAIFAYPPPFNIVALVILLPLKFCVSPRHFHAIHVAIVRVVNLPTLLLITLYERQYFSRRTGQYRVGKRKSFLHWNFTGFSPQSDVIGVFKAPPPPEICDEIELLDNLGDSTPGGGEKEEGGSSARFSLDATRPIRWRSRMKSGGGNRVHIGRGPHEE